MKKRIEYCDALRFIAIIFVILIHILADFKLSYLDTNKYASYIILSFFDSITRLAVPIFFMLTGVFMLGSKKEEKYSEFLKKRVSKLVIPFFLLSILYYVYFGLKNGTGLSAFQFFNAFTSNQIVYHFWFMYQIILIYLLIPFLRKLVQNLKKEELMTLILVIFSANVLSIITNISLKYDYNILASFVYPSILRYMNYLFLGYYLCHYEIEKKYRMKLYLFAILSFFIMTALDFFVTMDVKGDAFYLGDSAFPFITSTALFVLLKENYHKFKIPSAFSKFLTITSSLIFYIYMIHVLVLEYVKKFLFKFFAPNNFTTTCIFMFFEFLITFVISYILAYILNYLYSKVEKKLFQKNLA